MKLALKLFIICFWLMPAVSAQNVLRLAEGEAAGQARLTDLSWLSGHWVGEGFGGVVDELWMPARDNAMHGIFRLISNEQIQFTEYMVLTEHEGSLLLKLKHYSRDHKPWEEKNDWLNFKFIKQEGNTAYFNGLSFVRDGDTLTIYLQMKREGQLMEEVMRFTKQSL